MHRSISGNKSAPRDLGESVWSEAIKKVESYTSVFAGELKMHGMQACLIGRRGRYLR